LSKKQFEYFLSKLGTRNPHAPTWGRVLGEYLWNHVGWNHVGKYSVALFCHIS
jgi:hypothetical protein